MYQEVWQPENNFCPYFHSISKTGIFMVIVTQQCCKESENFKNYHKEKAFQRYITTTSKFKSDYIYQSSWCKTDLEDRICQKVLYLSPILYQLSAVQW